MSKSNFSAGAYVTPAYVQSIFGTDALTGHKHDSLDQDGHADKIMLDFDVAGKLPAGNLDFIPVDWGITGMLINSQFTGMSIDQSHVLGVTGANSGTYNGMGVSGVQRVYDGKNFQNLVISNSVSQVASQARMTAGHGTEPAGTVINTVVTKPSPDATGAIAYTSGVLGTGAYFKCVEMGWPLSTDLSSFYVDLLFFRGPTFPPFKLRCQIAQSLSTSYYAVPYNDTNGITNARPDWSEYRPADSYLWDIKVTIMRNGTEYWILNNTGTPIKLAGKIVTQFT